MALDCRKITGQIHRCKDDCSIGSLEPVRTLSGQYLGLCPSAGRSCVRSTIIETDRTISNNSQALSPLAENAGIEGIFTEQNIAFWVNIQRTSSAARKFKDAEHSPERRHA
jgi:hypothetical protein